MAETFSIGHLHPVLVHFPIVLFIVGLFCDLLNSMGKKAALPVAHWAIIAGALFCIPTLITGWVASESFPPNQPLISIHRFLAFTTSVVALLHALLRIAAMRQWIYKGIYKGQVPSLIYISCSVVTVLLVSITAEYGGRISHGVSLFHFNWW